VTLLLLLGLALVGLSGVLSLRSLTFAQARRQQTLAQIDAYALPPERGKRPAVRGPRELVAAIASAVGALALRTFAHGKERELRTLLDSAGFYRSSAATFFGTRILAAVCVPLATIALGLAGGGVSLRLLGGALFLGGFGWLLPKFLLERRASRRLEQVDREVPELVDLLVTSVEAGVGFGGALQLAARSIRGPLGDELRLALQEQSMGLTTDEALRNLAARVDSPAIRAFIQALLQGESLGVSIGKILRDIAVDMRKRRRQKAEEKAQKAPVKILFPLIVLILPAMFIFTLGPAVVQILRVLGSTE
jgi:tight adherence protein C